MELSNPDQAPIQKQLTLNHHYTINLSSLRYKIKYTKDTVYNQQPKVPQQKHRQNKLGLLCKFFACFLPINAFTASTRTHQEGNRNNFQLHHTFQYFFFLPFLTNCPCSPWSTSGPPASFPWVCWSDTSVHLIKLKPTNSNLSPQSKDLKNESAHTSSALTSDKCGSRAWLCRQTAGLAHRRPCTNPAQSVAHVCMSAFQLWRVEVGGLAVQRHQQHGKSKSTLRPCLNKIKWNK